jgi:hypothetical protein
MPVLRAPVFRARDGARYAGFYAPVIGARWISLFAPAIGARSV